jgi:hypothetical protein
MKTVTKLLFLSAAWALMALPLQAQKVIQPFEFVANDSTIFIPVASDGGTDIPEIIQSDYTSDPVEGESGLQVDWKIYTPEDWGGFLQLVNQIPDSVGTFYDLSDFTEIGLWHNTLTPASASQVEFRLLLFDSSGPDNDGTGGREETTREVWYSQSARVYSAGPGWKEFTLPLVSTGGGAPIPDAGFSRPGWSGAAGNDQLDLQYISGYALEWTSTKLGGDLTATGSVVFDKLFARGVRYQLIHGFDDLALGDTEVAGTGAGSLVFTTVTDSPVEGDGALQVDYTVDATEEWGGFTDFAVTLPGAVEDMTERSHISLFYNVVEPASIPEGGILRVTLHDNSDGVVEHWTFETADALVAEGGWTRLLMPVTDRGQVNPNDEGFSQPGWSGSAGNNRLDLDHIVGFTIHFVAPPSLRGSVVTGSVMFDRLTGYGFRNLDFTPPVPVENLAVTTGDFSNIVTWDDVPGEQNATYTLYYSPNPITSLDVDRLDVVASRVPTGTGILTHELNYPKVDSDVTYYYAITATDAAGNTSDVASLGAAVTNTAKGIPTIHLGTPTGFVADGQLSDWAGITPIRMAKSIGTKIITNTAVDDDQDLSANVFLAVDEVALYVAFEVTDDMVEFSGAANPWENDGTELYFGFYDGRGLKHRSYQRGAQPDYKFNFYGEFMRIDISGAPGELYSVESENYAVAPRFPTGYVIEARLPYSEFFLDETETFVPRNGMRIPLDIVLQDRDNGTREGIMVYSRLNEDNSWESPSNWSYTWIGDAPYVTVSSEAIEIPNEVVLHGNYPNPFMGQTTIRYTLPASQNVTLKVYNMLGQEVQVLTSGMQAPGLHDVVFDARSLASGIYFYRMQAGSQVITRTMTVVR